MATIKSYTDLDQSRKLAEILPIESADMSWTNNKLKKEVSANLSSIVEMQAYFDRSIYEWDRFYELTPCWSLAALLDVLPHRIDDRHALVSGKLSANDGWYVCYDDDNGDIDYYVHNSNLIDACYEMIMKLHEQKLL